MAPFSKHTVMTTKLTHLLAICFLAVALHSNSQTLEKMGSYNSDGVPNYLDNANENIGGALVADLMKILPNGENLLKSNPALYYGNTGTAIKLTQSADVYLAFVSEEADFKSAVGYYTYTGTAPTRASSLKLKLVFPNVSGAGSGGGLRQGNRVKLGNFPAGTSIGFFLVANGFRYSNVSLYGNDVFYSDPAYNPENSTETKKHSVLLYDESSKRFALMFEDFNRNGGSDHDFNDAIFLISANPSTAFNTGDVSVVEEEKEVKTGGAGKPTKDQKLTICHYPPGNTGNPQVLTIAANAWPAHKAHGDVLGECPAIDGNGQGGGQGTGKPGDGKPGGGKPGTGTPGTGTPGSGGGAPAGGGQNVKMITVCHYPPGQPNNPQEISIPESAWSVHQAHGDVLGSCSGNTTGTKMITVCHYPPGQPNNPQEISIPESAWSVHQAHGDVLGSCSGNTSQPSGSKMITVCHYPPGQPNNPQEISIPESAWAVHQAHGDVVGGCGNAAPSQSAPAKPACDMAAGDFNKLKGSVKSKPFSDDKKSTLKVGMKGKCITTYQVKDLLELFSFESDKLEMAKYLYDFTSDQDNYYSVGDVFSFSSSVRELNQFLERK